MSYEKRHFRPKIVANVKKNFFLFFRDIINYIFGSCIYLGWIVLIFDTLLGMAMICHPLDDEEAEKLLEEQELLYTSKLFRPFWSTIP